MSEPGASRLLHLAVAGCSHGEMDTIYDRLSEIEKQRKIKFNLLICCGDFQANRNYGDLEYFHAPMQHRKLKTFYKYYSGQTIAPVLTVFVGGNHESSAFMAELPNGGWVAPNIYYMGYSSVINYAGLRIAGLSGIYKNHDYNKGHFECPPFKGGSNISAYHVRSVDIFRLKQLSDSNNRLDIFITHDWPAGITDYGDKEWLLRIKPHFSDDVEHNRLGNPATMELLHELKPKFWFAAHMHVKFEALVQHQQKCADKQIVTQFLALDKPVIIQRQNQSFIDQRRTFLEFFEIPISDDAKMELAYDPQWLAILKSTDFLTDRTDRPVYMPSNTTLLTERHEFRPTIEELCEVNKLFDQDLRIPFSFHLTAPPETFVHKGGKTERVPPSLYYRNPQSTVFCEKLGIRNLNDLFAEASASFNFLGVPQYYASAPELYENAKMIEEKAGDPNEIDVEDEFGGESFIVD